MAQIISSPGLAALTGQSLGTGLGNALNQLTQMKMSQMLQQRQRAQTAQGLGSLFSPEQSQALAGLDPQLLAPIIKQQLQAPGNAAYLQSLQGLLGGENMAQAQPQGGLQALQQAMPQQSIPQMAPASVGQMPQPPAPITPSSQASSKLVLQPGINAQQATKLAELGLKQKATAQKEAYQEKKLALEEKKLAKAAEKEMTKEKRLEQHHIDKETQPIYDEVNKEFKAAKNNDKLLNRMNTLVDEGRLGVPFVNSFLKSLSKGIFGLGIDLTSWMNADAQEFEKLSSQLATGISNVFPGRILASELDVYMKQLPNLAQSGAGIKRVISSMKSANEAAKLRKEAMDEIIIANNGLKPRNLEILIEQKIGPQLDELANQFKNAPLIPEKIGGGIVRY